MENWYKTFNYGTLIFIFILVMLMAFKVVPPEWNQPLLYIGLAVFIMRIFFRIYILKKNR